MGDHAAREALFDAFTVVVRALDRSMPVTSLDRRLRDLPTDVEVVAYCRGQCRVFADDAVGLLRARGIRARRLEGGLPQWRPPGLPVASG